MTVLVSQIEENEQQGVNLTADVIFNIRNNLVIIHNHLQDQNHL